MFKLSNGKDFPTLADALRFVVTKRFTGDLITDTDKFPFVAGEAPRKRFSKKRLLPLLKAAGFIQYDGQVSYEAYGKDVQAFIGVQSMEDRRALEALLNILGQKVNYNYAPNMRVVNVGVTYFKAWHWDE